MTYPHRLHDNATARWYREVIDGRGSGARARYLAATAELLAGGGLPDGVAEARDAVVAAAGGRSASTLYALFGTAARDALLGRCSGPLRASQPCADVVDRLVAETKVWSHWPYREGWLAALAAEPGEDRRLATETLVRVLCCWAADHPALAAALDHAAPLSVVADLALVCGPEVPVPCLAPLLRRVVLLAVDPAGTSPQGVLNTVHRDVARLVFEPQPHAAAAVADLIESLGAVEYLIGALDDAERERLAAEIAPQLAYVLKLLRQQ